ncbi:MAG: tRNA (adenosine(37)-N6)-dimethylallyltransferase MiaA [Patescibacteria group bacterium]
MPLPKILAVVGPTASGKTDIGLALARAFEGEVIAADSRTIYRGLDIGTAKPVGERILGGDLKQMAGEKPLMVEGIPHWGLDITDPDKTFSVAEFQAYADIKIAEILERGHVPILVGGTGLYIRAVIDRPNFTAVPPDDTLRVELATLSNAELMTEIAERDPDTAATIDEDNRRRLERAIEILRATGKTLAETQKFDAPRYDALQLGIEIEREVLYARIDERVDGMIAGGLVDEVRELRNKYGTNATAMTGIGYRQICEFLDGKTKLRDAVTRIKFDSHHYAKRQETWFKRDDRIIWVRDAKSAVEVAQKFLQ